MQQIQVKKTVKKTNVYIVSIIIVLLVMLIGLIPLAAYAAKKMTPKYPHNIHYDKTGRK